jgi:hypothetical protein
MDDNVFLPKMGGEGMIYNMASSMYDSDYDGHMGLYNDICLHIHTSCKSQ